jgi:hypothetical protein
VLRGEIPSTPSARLLADFHLDTLKHRTYPAAMPRTRAQAVAQARIPPWHTQISARTLDDHGSAPVKIAWSRTNGDLSPLEPYPFHVYLIRGVDSLIADEALAYQLMRSLSTDYFSDPRWHLEVFTAVQDNVFACVNHYEQEKTFRKLESQAPYMPDKNCFLVVDSDNWKDEGLLYIEYTKGNEHLPYDVTAERYKSRDHLSDRLMEEWSDQCRENIEQLLDAQNSARGWQIYLSLYDESGPEHSVNGMTLAAREQASPIPRQSAYDALDSKGISVNIDGIVNEQCQDSGDSSYTALRRTSSQSPLFVFCLFVLGRDISSEESLRVFARLNTGLLAGVSWALHLYSNVTMSSASSIFTQDMGSRTNSDTSSRVPASYVGHPLQIYRHVYMCLDASKPQPNGPSFILSSPDPDHAPPHKLNVDPTDLDRVPSHRDKYAGEADSLDLWTFNPGSWELAADMLHTYFAFCHHTQSVTRSLSPPNPGISLRISVNPEYSSDAAIPSPMELFITSHASEPITLNVKDTIFDARTWGSYLRIVDADELPMDMARGTPTHKWALGERLLDYGFTKRVPDSGDDRPPHLVTLYPGVPLQLPVQRALPTVFLAGLRPDENKDDKRFLEHHEAEGKAYFNIAKTFGESLYQRHEGSWEIGKKYNVELRQNTTIPRWTWGAEEELKGPWGLPALEIEVEEGGNRDFVLTD